MYVGATLPLGLNVKDEGGSFTLRPVPCELHVSELRVTIIESRFGCRCFRWKCCHDHCIAVKRGGALARSERRALLS